MARKLFTKEEDDIIIKHYRPGRIKYLYALHFEGKRTYSVVANRIFYLKQIGVL